MNNPAVYVIHWLRRWRKGRIYPLTRLLYDPVLDGPIVTTLSSKPPEPDRRRGRPPGSKQRRHSWAARPHSGPLTTIGAETFCEKCGIGVDEAGFYERAAAGHGAPVTAERLEQLAHYATEQEAIKAAQPRVVRQET